MKTVVRSTATLTGAHGLGYLISLAEVPVLARALGPTAYGELLWVQATALLASLLVEYGFSLSASREIARNRGDSASIKRICGEVFVAKLMLLSLVTAMFLIAYLAWTPVPVGMAAAGYLYFLGFGLTPFWYFQGLERMGHPVAVEILMRLIALIGLFYFVDTPSDGTLALTIMAISSIACTGATILMCWRETGNFEYSLRGGINQLYKSTSIFLYKSSTQVMATAATSILGIIAGKVAVGFFAPAEKLVKAVTGLATPLFHAFYPHLSRLFIENRQKNIAQAKKLIVFVTIFGLSAATILALLGPVIITWMLGPGFDKVNQLLTAMVWLIPLRLLNQTLGFAVLLPAQLEGKASTITLISSGLSLGLGAYLTISYGAMGMVMGMLIGEATLAIAQIFMVTRLALLLNK